MAGVHGGCLTCEGGWSSTARSSLSFFVQELALRSRAPPQPPIVAHLHHDPVGQTSSSFLHSAPSPSLLPLCSLSLPLSLSPPLTHHPPAIPLPHSHSPSQSLTDPLSPRLARVGPLGGERRNSLGWVWGFACAASWSSGFEVRRGV